MTALSIHLLLAVCLLLSFDVNDAAWFDPTIANDEQDFRVKTGINDLLYPTDSLLSNPANIWGLTPGLVPPTRVKGTITYLEPLIIVCGGYNTDGSLMDDIHMYDTRVRLWSGGILKRGCCNNSGKIVERSGATEETPDTGLDLPAARQGFAGDIPAPRAEHGACSYDGVFYIFGGVEDFYEQYLTNVMYSFDPIHLQWKLIDRYGGQGPTRRAGHSMVTDFDKGALVVFGGRAVISGRTVGLSDVWIFDVASRKWEWASARAGRSGEPSPAGRQYAASAIVRSTLFVVGGLDPVSHVIFNDVWAFELGRKKWKQISAHSGQETGFAPPPLYHASLLPLLDQSGPNGTSFQHASLLLFGGVGGGGACGEPDCGQLQTSMGQVYRLPLAFDAYDIDTSGGPSSEGPLFQEDFNSKNNGIAGLGIDGQGSRMDLVEWRLSLNDAHWSFARLSDSSDSAMLHGRPNARGRQGLGGSGPGGGGALGRGRLLKTWALEATCFDPERGLLYELGGLQAISVTDQKAAQMAVELTGPSLLETGQEYEPSGDSNGVADGTGTTTNAPLWDKHAQEHLHTMAQLPTNLPWVFHDAFEKTHAAEHARINGTIRFMRIFRTYHVSAFENIVLQTADDNQASIPI